MTYLNAALTVTWVIHIGYLLYLTSRFSRLRQEVKDLERGK